MTRRVRAARRDRRTVLAGLTIFALAQVALSLVADTRHPEYRDPAFGARLAKLRARLGERPGRPLILALGSSRVENGLRPDELALPDNGPLVFNFGQPGAGPLHEWITLQRLRAEGIRPQRLLIEVMPAMLMDRRTVADSLSVERMSVAELVALAPFNPHLSEPLFRQLESRLAPIHTWRFALMSRLIPAFLPWSSRLDYLWNGLDDYGNIALLPDFANLETRLRAVQRAQDEYHDQLARFTITPEADHALRQLLDGCRRDQTLVRLVLMPEGEQFRSWYPSAASTTISAYLASLSREFGVSVIDARTWIADDNFFDGHHLLPAGAIAFSQRLGREARTFLVPE